MPKIYEYMGIVIRFYSNDHEPVHVHAIYGNNIIKVSFHIKTEIKKSTPVKMIYRTTYKTIAGKFSPSKGKELKKFVSTYKYNIIEKWEQYFKLHQKPVFSKITIKF